MAHGHIISGDLSAIHQSGRCGDLVYLTEHKHCPSCGKGETRMNAPVCCWCGVHHAVIKEEISLKPKWLLTPTDDAVIVQRKLLPAKED